MTRVDELLTSTVLIPVLLLVLKSLIGQEIYYWITFIGCYFHRPFDLDKNPDTHDWLMIFNSASGEWECCSLTYHFGLRKGGNGAFVHHYDVKWNHRFTERVPFGKWKQTGKGKLGDINLIEGLLKKMQKMKVEEISL